jgi:Zn-dependent protease
MILTVWHGNWSGKAMKWSWNLARVRGTDVKIHVTFVALLAWIALDGLASGGLASAFGSVTFIILLFGCVLLHEFGHVTAARVFGIRTPDITLYPIGGVARLERMPEKPVQELIVALAGPAVNVVIAGGLFLLLGAGVGLGGIKSLGDPGAALLARLAAVNIFLVVFNLIPAFPMDGGRVLRAVLALRMGFLPATRNAAKVGRALAIVFGIYGLFSSPMLVFIAVFVYLAAGKELAAVELRERATQHHASPFAGFGGSPFADEFLRQTRVRDHLAVPVIDERGNVVGWTSDDDISR